MEDFVVHWLVQHLCFWVGGSSENLRQVELWDITLFQRFEGVCGSDFLDWCLLLEVEVPLLGRPCCFLLDFLLLAFHELLNNFLSQDSCLVQVWSAHIYFYYYKME